MTMQSDAERAACRELRCAHRRCFLHDRPHCPVCPSNRHFAIRPPACAACAVGPAAPGSNVCETCTAAGNEAPSLF